MLVVAMVATLSAASMWKQWQGVEVESAERARIQSAWILTGALDWARLILREDARSGAADHYAEPWALPLQEARLSSFLDIPDAAGEAGEAVFLSGGITDLQSRLNIASLASLGILSEPGLRSFTRLFEVLALPRQELSLMAENVRRASDVAGAQEASSIAPAPPQRLEHLASLGLSPATVAALEPYVTVLPVRTPVNLNTASAEVIYSAAADISLADAKRIVAARGEAPFRSPADASRLLPDGAPPLVPADFGVGSRFFEVHGRLRMGAMAVEERSVVQRDGLEVSVLQRGRVGTRRAGM